MTKLTLVEVFERKHGIDNSYIVAHMPDGTARNVDYNRLGEFILGFVRQGNLEIEYRTRTNTEMSLQPCE